MRTVIIVIGLRFLLVLLKFVSTANSFLHHNFFNNAGWKNYPHRRKFHSSVHNMQHAAERDCTKYGMGGVDLYSRWITLVDQGHVTATTTLTNEEICTANNDDDDGTPSLNVRYGVKLVKGEEEMHLAEFVELLNEKNVRNCKMKERILSINHTLAEMQSKLWTIDSSYSAASGSRGAINNSSSSNSTGLAIKCIYDGQYVAQLQLVRTLRPPRSKEMSGTAVAKTASDTAAAVVSCQPPPYNPSNSFLVGPLRLFGQGDFHGEGEPRVRMARLSATPNEADQRMWDIYHNISPVDPRGHFLLVPDLEESTTNWRDQSLIATDCHDISYLASTIQPPGSLVVTFNSVGAGASQNHIHCHGWACPPAPFVGQGGRSGCYAVENAAVTSSLKLQNGTTVSLLDYPCTCIKLSVTIDGVKGSSKRRPSAALDEIGRAIATIVHIAQEMESPHNVAWTNSNNNNEQGSVTLNSYIFFRSKAETIIPNTNVYFRLGASEAMGVFHCSSNDQMESLSGEMESILSAVSTLPRDIIWNRVETEFSKL